MTRRRVVFFALCFLLLSVLSSSASAEVLFGPVTVTGGQTHTATFPMYCRCTSYFVEVANVSTEAMRSATISLNGQVVMEVGNEWTQMSRQVELAETEPNEIEIVVPLPAGAGVEVQVYERDVTPSPMVARDYVKVWGRKWERFGERFGERFVLNHWASRFHLVVENGDPDGSHRVTSGQVWVNGVEVIGTGQLHSGVASVSVEVELEEGENDVQALLLGPPGRKIWIGIEEPAQTVTVTEVWEVPIVGVPGGCIGIRDGQVSVKLLYGRTALMIDESGVVDSVVTEYNPDRSEYVNAYSAHGNYIITSGGEGPAPTCRVYDWQWNQVGEWTWPGWGMAAISDSGNTLVCIEYAGSNVSRMRRAVWYYLYDQMGTMLATIPAGNCCGEVGGDRWLTSPDGMTVARFGPDDLFSVYNRDGSLRYEVDKGFLFSLANGGLAAQGASDVLTFYGSDGAIQRRVVGNPPKPPDSGAPYLTPDGEHAMHLGVGVAMAKRTGRQSCWRFNAPEPGWVAEAWVSDDGRWAAGVSEAAYGADQRQALWLVGAGGSVFWDVLLEGSPGVSARTMFTEDGQYFYYTEHDLPSGDRCVLMHIEIEDRGR